MQQLSLNDLARTVATQSTGVSVRIGETNGEPVLHLIHHKSRRSRTIPATAVAWNLDPWNEQPPYPAPKEAS